MVPLETVVEALAESLSAFCSISTTFQLKKGGIQGVPIDCRILSTGTMCTNCGGPKYLDDVLCNKCKPIEVRLKPGDPYHVVHYNWGSAKYRDTDEKRRTRNKVVYQRICCLESRSIASLFEKRARESASANVNLQFDTADYRTWEAFREKMVLSLNIDSSKQTVHEPLSVGGLGVLLAEEVERRVFKWLFQMDQRMCGLYNISCFLSQEEGCRLKRVYCEITEMITRTVCGMEEMNQRGEAKGGLNTRALESINEAELCLSKQAAEEVARSDAIGLRDLAVVCIAQPGEECNQLHGEWASSLVHLLEHPCPEMALCPPQDLASLASVLRSEESLRALVLERWQSSGTAAVCLSGYLSAAADSISSTTSRPFINVLRFRPPPCTARSLPLATWVKARLDRVQLMERSEFAKQRVALSSTGLRIVLVTSVVWELFGSPLPERPFFSSGVLDPNLVVDVASIEIERCNLSIDIIDQDLIVLQAGMEMTNATHVLQNCGGSHVESEVYACFCHVSHLSLRDVLISAAPAANKERIRERTIDLLPVKTIVKRDTDGCPIIYDGFFEEGLSLFLRLLVDARTFSGLDARSLPISEGDMLLKSPHIRRWFKDAKQTGAMMPLELELTRLNKATKAVLDRVQEMVPFGQVRRVRKGTKNVLQIHPDALKRILSLA